MRALPSSALAALLVCTAGCIGPYANLAEKYDEATAIGVAQTTWLKATDTDTQFLVLGELDEGAATSPFSLTRVTKHNDAIVRSGLWRRQDADHLVLEADLLQQRLNEYGTPVISQTGSTRKNIAESSTVSARVSEAHLYLDGDPLLSGTWLSFGTATLALASKDAAAAECALRLVHIQIAASQARVPSFGGPGSIQYSTPQTFLGTVAGTMKVQLFGLFSPRTDSTYTGFSDFGALVLDGLIASQTNTSGDGWVFGTVGFTFPQRGASVDLLKGSVTFGQEDGGGDTLQVQGGAVYAGWYHVALEGGETVRLPHTTILENSYLAGCLPQ